MRRRVMAMGLRDTRRRAVKLIGAQVIITVKELLLGRSGRRKRRWAWRRIIGRMAKKNLTSNKLSQENYNPEYKIKLMHRNFRRMTRSWIFPRAWTHRRRALGHRCRICRWCRRSRRYFRRRWYFRVRIFRTRINRYKNNRLSKKLLMWGLREATCKNFIWCNSRW